MHEILGKKEVTRLVGLSYTTIWREMQKGEFPRPIQLSPRRVGWTRQSIQAHLESRILASK